MLAPLRMRTGGATVGPAGRPGPRGWSSSRAGPEGWATVPRSTRALRPGTPVERLERRELPAASLPAFLAATGFGVAGKNPAIHANAVATDAAGNSVVVGSFRGTVNFAPSNAGASFTSDSTQDAFVASYAADGSFNWARTFAGGVTSQANGATTTAVGQGSAVAVDASGSIFVAGSFTGSVNFGTAGAPQVLASGGNSDSFVARLDPTGNLVWVRAAAASGGDNQANALASDGQGGIVVAGFFTQAAGFGMAALTSAASTDLYVARYSGAGAVLWATASRGAAGSNAQAVGIAVDPAGNIALAGFYSGTVNLAPGAAAGASTAAGSFDAFAAKLTPAGQFAWARPFGSTDYDTAGAIAFDPAGNVVVAGTFSGSVNFGTGARPDVLTAGPVFSAFVARLDPGGAETWARAYVGASGWTKGQAVAVDPLGVIHVGGALSGSADFDPGAGVVALASVGSTDAFAAGLDPGGGFVYAARAGQANFNSVLGLAVDAAGVVSLAGTYSGSIAFGPLAVAANGLASAFVARLQTQPTPAPSAPALRAGSLTGINNTTSATAPAFDVASAGPTNVVQLLRDGAIVARRTGPGVLVDPGPVAQGVHLYTAVQVSAADIASAASPATTVTILTTPPAAPPAPALLAADDSGTVGDSITNVRAPRLTVAAPSAAAVSLLNASNAVVGTSATAAGGVFTVAIASPLADGTHAFRAVATDAAGNVGLPGPSTTVTISTALPARLAAPALIPADDTGTVGDGMTAVRRLRIAGTAAPGARVEWIAANGAVLASTTATASGSYVLQAPTALANGTLGVTVRQVNSAGNAGIASPPLGLTVRATTGDYFGQSTTQVAIFRPSNSTFYVWNPAWPGLYARPFADVGDVPISGDFFGDGTGDIAVFRPGSQTFYLLDPSTGAYSAQQWGTAGDVPVPADYDGDGRADVAVFRPSTATVFARLSGSNTILARQWGLPGDIPVPGDYFGIGRAAVAVFRPSDRTFYAIDPTTGATLQRPWGGAGDIPVPGDYDGDGKADPAVYNPTTNIFYAFLSTTNAAAVRQWGTTGDIPVAGDYFGGGRASFAIFRPGNQTFYAVDPSSGSYLAFPWGTAGDRPIQPPIGTSFNLGGSGNGRTLAYAGGRSGGIAEASPVGAAPDAEAIPIPAIVERPSSLPANRLGAAGTRSRGLRVDRALAALDLERWRGE